MMTLRLDLFCDCKSVSLQLWLAIINMQLIGKTSKLAPIALVAMFSSLFGANCTQNKLVVSIGRTMTNSSITRAVWFDEVKQSTISISMLSCDILWRFVYTLISSWMRMAIICAHQISWKTSCNTNYYYKIYPGLSLQNKVCA